MAEQERRDRLEIVSPVGGVVTTIAYSPGQTVEPGTRMATVLPSGSELVACLLIPSRAVGFVEVGQTTQLRISAYLYQKFGQVEGHVAQVDQSPIAAASAGSGLGPPQLRFTTFAPRATA